MSYNSTHFVELMDTPIIWWLAYYLLGHTNSLNTEVIKRSVFRVHFSAKTQLFSEKATKYCQPLQPSIWTFLSDKFQSSTTNSTHNRLGNHWFWNWYFYFSYFFMYILQSWWKISTYNPIHISLLICWTQKKLVSFYIPILIKI